MSGVYVGIDGSSHSQVALNWAMREAGYRHQPLTVITGPGGPYQLTRSRSGQLWRPVHRGPVPRHSVSQAARR